MKLKDIETKEEFELICVAGLNIFLANKKGEIIVERAEPLNRNSSFNKRYIVVKEK